MARTATFLIEINGLKESISAVESLNAQLDGIEKRLDAISKMSINVTTPKSSRGGSEGLEAEEKLQRQIINAEDKIIAARTDEYQILLQQKAEFKEINEVQKANVAQARLSDNAYAETMQGLKQKLADIKAVMQTMDLGDDKFVEMAKQANDLNNQLKAIEQSYGQFGRSVGNYAGGVVEGLGRVTIKVGETEREFKSASAATRTLKNELNGLAIEGKRGTKEWEEVKQALTETQTAIKGTSVGMQRLMDTMQSFVAIASVSKGLGALFGVDDAEIQKSIQQLMALQAALNGLDTINKQIANQKGIGYWLTHTNKSIDGFAAKLVKVEKGASSAANKVTMLAGAMKTFAAAIVVAAIAAYTLYMDKLKKKLDAIKETAEENANVVKAGAEAYATAKLELQGYITKIEKFNGNTEQEKKLVDELNSKFGNAIGQYKTLTEWKQALIDKSPAFLQMLKNEAIAMANLKNYADKMAEAMAKNAEAEELINKVYGDHGQGGVGPNTYIGKKLLKRVSELQEAAKKAEAAADNYEIAFNKIYTENEQLKKDNGLGTYSEQLEKDAKKIKDNSKKIEDAVRQAEDNINALKLKLMKDGLYKELAQLDENNRKEIEKIKKNGQKVEEQLLLQQKVYEKEQEELLKKYIGSLTDSNYINGLNNTSETIQRLKEEWENLYMVVNRPTSTKDAPLFGYEDKIDAGELYKQLQEWGKLYDIRNDEISKNNWEGYFEALKKQYLPKAAKEVQEEFFRLLGQTRPDSFDEWLEGDALITKKPNKEAYQYLRKQFEDETSELKYFLTKYQGTVELTEKGITQTLEDSYLERASLISERYKNVLDVTNKFIKDKLAIDLELIDKEEKTEKDAINERLKTTREGYEKLLAQSKKYSAYTSESVAEYLRTKDTDSLTDEEKRLQAFITLIDEQEKERTQIVQKYTNQRKKIQLDADNEMLENNARYYDKTISSVEEYMQKANDILSNQPERIGLFNFTDIAASKKQYKEVLDLYKHMEEDLNVTIKEALLAFNSSDPETKISGEQFERVMQNVEFYKKKIKESTAEIQENMKELLPNLLKDINYWVQEVGRAATQIIQSISEINNAALQNEIDAIDKQTELLQEALDKQKEITQKHADDVNDIEDELASARGDRRQFLIDQLNAEMQAQRESLAQEKRMEKEKEALDKKRDDLEFQQKMNQWNASKLTAMINAALAISAAAVNTYPIPAVPMMALAASVGAAQVAAVMAAKPKRYASGGLLEGPDHKHGGIPVGNSGIEVEGHEYVIRKESSIPNIDLLSYINRKKRKLSLDDFIDFYSKNSIKGSIERVRPKYANGGQLPTLRNDIDINNRLITAIDDFANKQTVVSVVDIINKADNVRQVRALSGLKQN